MPGFNKKGPQNEGPITGGRKGLCISDNNENQDRFSVGPGPVMGRNVDKRAGRCGGRGLGRGLSHGAQRVGKDV